MRTSKITRDEALKLLEKYNKEPFHIQHGLTVEGVMRWYAKKNLDTVRKKNTGDRSDCSMILILNCIQNSIVSKHQIC